jgi:magnesium transporter
VDGVLDARELLSAWPVLTPEERAEGFEKLPRVDADDFFLSLDSTSQAQLLRAMPGGERRLWARLLPPDDVADVVQEMTEREAADLLAQLDEPTRREALALLAYAEDEAGGLMSPRFARLRPDMTVDEALVYLRRQARAPERVETMNYAYALDPDQKLLGVVSLRDLFAANGAQRVEEVMAKNLVLVPEGMDQEEVARTFRDHDLFAIPVVDADGRMKGIVTVDDIVDAMEEEATEDIQKLGGQEALEGAYLDTSLPRLVAKRAPWLAVLLLGEMSTASAMGAFEDEIASAVVLALFVPLIISSGGNSGSQASTLIIRAMALGEVGLRDWWRVVHREVFTGLVLGMMLALIGFARVAAWEWLFGAYGEHWWRVGMTIGMSLIGVVTYGTLAGSMLPFAIRALKLDPASASAPLVATLVDVSGLVIYFSVARWLLSGTLL